MKLFKFILLPLILLLSINAHAQAVPKPVEPSPTLPRTSANQERHTYIDRPYKSANSETYTTKKIPLDKSKMGKWFKKLSKPDILSVGILVLGEAVDYVMNPANNTVRFLQTNCHIFTSDIGKPFDIDAYSLKVCKHFGKDYRIKEIDYLNNYNRLNMVCGNGSYTFHLYCAKPKSETSEIPLDELADKLIDSAKKGNPDAKKWVQDWADDEVRTNPDAYPEHQPSQQPNPKDEPQTEPRPNPSPDTNPNAEPRPKPSETIKSCENGYYRTAHGFCVPDPAYNPDDTKDNPKPSDEPSPNPNTDPNPQPNPKDKEQKPSELPAFCDWAGVVCDFIDWFQNDNVEKDKDTELDVDNKDIDIDSVANRQYFSFSKQCPQNPSFSVAFPFNINFSIEFPLHIICRAFIIFKPVIILFAYIKALSIVGRDL